MSEVKRKLAAGEKVTYKNVGFGLVSYETDTVTGMRNGRLITGSYESTGMEWDDARNTWKFDVGLGMVSYIVPNDDPEAVKYLKQSDSDEDAPATKVKKVRRSTSNRGRRSKRRTRTA